MSDLSDHLLEAAKLYQDSFKHMMTFCSGAILFSSSLVAALLRNPEHLGYLGLSIGLFALGAGTAMYGLYITTTETININPSELDQAKPIERYLFRRQRVILGFSVFLAYAGVVTFVLFALWNFQLIDIDAATAK